LPHHPRSRVSGPRPEAERRERHSRILQELADIGMELVQHVRRQALEEVAPSSADPVLAFTRLARAVRQTIALDARLATGAVAPVRPVAQGNAAARPGIGLLRARVRRSVEEAIATASEADGADGEAAEALLLDMHEQLDDPEFEDELAEWPIGVVVASICRALRVEVDLAHFSDAEMGLDAESIRPDRRPDRCADAGDDTGNADGTEVLPIWPPRTRTGLDPP
jgi:hypothetical protein